MSAPIRLPFFFVVQCAPWIKIGQRILNIAPLTPPALESTWRANFAGSPKEALALESRCPLLCARAEDFCAGPRWALALAVGAALGFFLKRAPSQPLMRAAVNLPSGNTLVFGNAAVLSPDGKRVVMNLADAQGRPKLWVRSLSNDGAQPLEGIEGGLFPFWSPDSSLIAFFAVDGKLRKIPAGGGPTEAVCDVWQIYGGTWGHDGVIVFATGRQGLFQVPASGGTPGRIPISEKDDADYRRPSFLPDGKKQTHPGHVE